MITSLIILSRSIRSHPLKSFLLMKKADCEAGIPYVTPDALAAFVSLPQLSEFKQSEFSSRKMSG
jgi:hypothetical protein